MQPWWLVYGVVGWGFSSWLIVFFSKPDPGPAGRTFIDSLRNRD
jgi:hypothetical protein